MVEKLEQQQQEQEQEQSSSRVDYLEFEAPILVLEEELQSLEEKAQVGEGEDVEKDIGLLKQKIRGMTEKVYSSLSPWQTVQVARCESRPHTTDYIAELIDNFEPLAGDQLFSEDVSIIGGIGKFQGQSVVVIGNNKGEVLEEKVKSNFGMAKPEGYRKAVRLMNLAERFSFPLITFVDTPGAYPGIDAEQRGQAVALAKAIERSFTLKIPSVSFIIGEGGSGGAVALACSSVVCMLEYAIYSVISPEGCASILWRDVTKKEEAARNLKLRAQDMKAFGIVDRILEEPLGGAHRNSKTMIHSLGKVLCEEMQKLSSLSPGQLQENRRERFLSIAKVFDK